ncbi:hypothetical protein [Periweissella beninensis]|uniref:ParB/Spo0J HTH domain-containing protein n=1 Tax=Periweissella beninensis TaxID=504936 RepID=A0ABT0VKI9_9LACO|nr:hypothetical protein [Periweissella beninensis]MBM7543937.1 ParB-like chromosome segregation protein Spo0J [Periweissella beninensis]MCM2437663.1 hypothetical protein [Periweissella beninensis]MCT4396143.1 hypothetical protein [Periweissella beninensis]
MTDEIHKKVQLSPIQVDRLVQELRTKTTQHQLSILAEAKCYAEIMRLSDYTQVALAHELGKSQATIANKVRLLKLGQPAKTALEEGLITERHARALLKLDKRTQANVVKKIIQQNLTVKVTEMLVKKLCYNQLDLPAQQAVVQDYLTVGIEKFKKQGIYLDYHASKNQITLKFISREEAERKT